MSMALIPCWSLTQKLTGIGAEVKRVRTRAPYSIIFSTVASAIIQWAFLICILFTIGNVEAVTNTPTQLPIIEVYYLATNSMAATNVFVVAIATVVFVGLFNSFASVSRLTWAFARDRGLPFSDFFSKVGRNIQRCTATGLLTSVRYTQSLECRLTHWLLSPSLPSSCP